MPLEFNTQLLQNHANSEDTVYHSKAVGEPPFMLAISVWSALKNAITYAVPKGPAPQLNTPATPERVLMAIHSAKNASA